MASLDPKTVASAPERSLSAVGYRNQARGYDPRSGEGARRFGGRFNPPRSFPVLYLCTTRACVVAELTRQASRQSLQVGDFLPRELWEIEVALTRVLDLTDDAVLEGIGISSDDLVQEDHRLTRQIGEAAHEHRFQAIRTPSATGVDQVLAIFPEKLGDVVLDAERIEVWSETKDLPA